MAAASAVHGPKTIFVDPRFAAPTIPAGVWNLGPDTTLSGSAQPNNPTVLTALDGAKLAGVIGVRDLELLSMSTTSLIDLPNFDSNFFLAGNAMLMTGSTGPILQQNNARLFSLFVLDLSSVNNSAPFAAPIHMKAGSLTVYTRQEGFVDANTIFSAPLAHAAAQMGDAASYVDPNQPQVTSAGGFQIALAPQAQYVSQQIAPPATLADWAGFAPLNVRDAINRLAHHIALSVIGPTP